MSKQPTYFIGFDCPHCGFHLERRFPVYAPLQIVTCPVDDGGCDQDFVIDPGLRVVCEPQVYRIEGIGEPVHRAARPEEDTAW